MHLNKTTLLTSIFNYVLTQKLLDYNFIHPVVYPIRYYQTPFVTGSVTVPSTTRVRPRIKTQYLQGVSSEVEAEITTNTGNTSPLMGVAVYPAYRQSVFDRVRVNMEGAMITLL